MALNIKNLFPLYPVRAVIEQNRVGQTRPPEDQSNVFDPKDPAYKPPKKKKEKKECTLKKLNIIN